MLQAQIYIDKDELHDNMQPLYEFIFAFLIRHGIRGATAFRGEIGFGPKQHMKRPDEFFSFDEPPMMITFIDGDIVVREVLAKLRATVSHGIFITHAVEAW